MGQAEAVAVSHIPFVDETSYPVRAGNRVRPLVDGEPAFRRICQAVESAKHSVWVTVAFIQDLRMPDGRGSFFDVLDRAVARGLDVRVIFWRNNEGSGFEEWEIFSGLAEHREMLRGRGSRFHARWDRAQKAYCQHQKSWLVDAGQPSEIAFVGGINLNLQSVVAPGHAGEVNGPHDLYVEIEGPSATDVHHNFVQRWNEASDRAALDGLWGDLGGQDLAFPTRVSAARGSATAQVQRTVRAGHYEDDHATPGGRPFDIARGDLANFAQYRRAIQAARSTIYVENQALGSTEIVEDLLAALARGVVVAVLVPPPSNLNRQMAESRKRPESQPFFQRLGALGDHPDFTFAAIAARLPDGSRRDTYVHAKAMLIDDTWATIGSCNIGARSFFGDTELNAAFHDPEVVRALRVELLEEHLGRDTSGLDDRAALRLYGEIARENGRRRASGDNDWEGAVFAHDPKTYGT